MTYPIILPNGSSGIMQVTVNLTSFAADFGNYIFTTSSQTAPPLLVANKHFPYNVPALTGSKPFFQSEKTEQVIWLPLTFNNQQPIAWIGERINSSAALKWKKSLILNIVALLAVTAMAITIIASIIARKVERLKVELVEGLNQIMNDNQQVNFTWSFPDELQNLALDLTNLSKNYNQSRAANRAAQKKLQESEDKFRKLTSSAQDGIIMMDNQGNIAYWNKGAERIFRFSARQAMGKSSHKLLNLRRPDQENSNDKQITTKHVDISRPSKPDVIELTARRNDNQDIPIELSLSSTEIKGQWHAIWIIRDISERKKAEAEAFLRQQQLIQSDKMRSLGLLVSGVAHEINNPNSISMLNTSLLHKAWHEITPILDNYYKQNGDFLVAGLNYSEMRQQIPRLFTELAESNKRIKSIVHDLKDYARKKEPDSSELADINEIINTAARLTRNQIKKCGADFNVNFSTPQIVKGNKQRLEQVIINLLQNACEAVIDAKDAEISITTNKVDVDKVIITVADNGIGIKVEDLNLITDPFYTTRRTLGGTGLGLSVSAGIIKEHRGNLSFKSAPGNGTLAIITLPLANS